MKQILFALFVFALGFNTAHAADTTKPAMAIGVIDVMRLVAQSDAGKSINAQLSARANALNAEAQSIEQALIKEEDAIVAAKASLKPEEFEAKKNAFAQKLNANRESLNRKNESLEKARASALSQLQQHIAKISANIADQKKLNLIVDRASVVIVEQGLDVTGDALKQLNATVKSIKVGG